MFCQTASRRSQELRPSPEYLLGLRIISVTMVKGRLRIRKFWLMRVFSASVMRDHPSFLLLFNSVTGYLVPSTGPTYPRTETHGVTWCPLSGVFVKRDPKYKTHIDPNDTISKHLQDKILSTPVTDPTRHVKEEQ